MERAFFISIPSYVQRALSLLEARGFSGWCVGGCVRDSLLGGEPHDWDLTTNALPEETRSCFPDLPCIEIGMRHGTVGVIIDGHTVEITTLRSDGEYSDARHPDGVRFSASLEEDLARRDFTINAMAYRKQEGLIDPFHGQEDLERRLLRCVGEPEKRFSEDALRILRCLRFSSVLGFEIQEETSRALKKLASRLCNISRERIREEVIKLLCGQNAAQILRAYPQVIFTILPQLAAESGCAQECKYHCYDVWEHSLHTLESISPSPCLRLAALLHDCGKPACKSYDEQGTAHFYGHAEKSEALARESLVSLRLPSREVDFICLLIRHHNISLPLSEKTIKKLLNIFGPEDISQFYSLLLADSAGKPGWLLEERTELIRRARSLTKEILERKDCFSLKNLEINGKDLLALGYLPGPQLGETLSRLLEEVMAGELENSRDKLLTRAKKTRR